MPGQFLNRYGHALEGKGKTFGSNLEEEGSLGVHLSSAHAPRAGLDPETGNGRGRGYRLTRKDNY